MWRDVGEGAVALCEAPACVQAVVVVKKRVDVPAAPFFKDRTQPLLIQTSALDRLRTFARAEGMTMRNVDIASAGSAMDVIVGLKAVLPVPAWCGSSWDSFDDAFEEIRSGLKFPEILVLWGGLTCWSRNQHVFLQTVLMLATLSDAFSSAGDQFTVVYAADSWGD